jgi:hypothetical protein
MAVNDEATQFRGYAALGIYLAILITQGQLLDDPRVLFTEKYAQLAVKQADRLVKALSENRGKAGRK